jgi:hypothetical protein
VRNRLDSLVSQIYSTLDFRMVFLFSVRRMCESQEAGRNTDVIVYLVDLFRGIVHSRKLPFPRSE